MTTPEILSEAKQRLQAAYGDRLRGVVLHGSEARGEAGADSDTDLLVLLDTVRGLYREIDTIVEALYPLILVCERHLDAQPVAEADYLRAEYAVYRFAQAEGVWL